MRWVKALYREIGAIRLKLKSLILPGRSGCFRQEYTTSKLDSGISSMQNRTDVDGEVERRF